MKTPTKRLRWYRKAWCELAHPMRDKELVVRTWGEQPHLTNLVVQVLCPCGVDYEIRPI